MPSFTPNTGECSHLTNQQYKLKRNKELVLRGYYLSTGTPWQKRFHVYTSYPRPPGGTAYQCHTASPPSGTQCWADSRPPPKPSFREFLPCLRQTRWVWLWNLVQGKHHVLKWFSVLGNSVTLTRQGSRLCIGQQKSLESSCNAMQYLTYLSKELWEFILPFLLLHFLHKRGH